MAEYDTSDYFGGAAKELFKTDSPFPVSSSPWLNDARVREYMAKHSLRRNHPDVPATYDITEIIPIITESHTKRIRRIEELFAIERRKNPALDAWFEEKFVSNFTMESLSQYPHGSLGNLFYRFVHANDFVPEFRPDMQFRTQYEYFGKRLSQQHDMEHLLGNFGFDYLGEQGVTWMRSAAYFEYLSPELAGILNETYAFLLTPQVMRTMLHYPQAVPAVFAAMHQGQLVGRTSEPVYMMKYEPVMHLPLAEARERLGYRNTAEWPHRDVAIEWSEGVKLPLDPRLDEDVQLAVAAE